MLLWFIVGSVAVVAGIMVAAPVMVVLNLSKIEARPTDPAEAAEHRAASEAGLGQRWIEGHGFEWVNAYTFAAPGGGALVMRVWRQPDGGTYLCHYTQPNGTTVIDFVSVFSHARSIGVTTSNTRDTHTLPSPPGSFTQSFSEVHVEQQWRLHLDAEAFIAELMGLQPEPVEVPFEELLEQAVRGQAAYVRGLPLWMLRGPYWFMIRRGRMHGRTVEELVGRGLLPVPGPASIEATP